MSYGETKGEKREDAIIRLHGAVGSYHKSKVSALAAALAGGRALNDLKPLVSHGEWANYLTDEGLTRGRAWNWRRLADLGMSAQQIHDQGGMVAVLKKNKVGKPPVELACGHPDILGAPKGRCSHCAYEALLLDEDVVISPKECWRHHYHRFESRRYHGSDEAFTYQCALCDHEVTQSQLRTRRALLPPAVRPRSKRVICWTRDATAATSAPFFPTARMPFLFVR